MNLNDPSAGSSGDNATDGGGGGGGAETTAGDGHVPATSRRQTEANRANAQRSTGPNSAAGKHRSARNAETHGAYGRRPDINPIERGPLAEDQAELEALRDAILDAYTGYGPVVRELAVNFARDLMRRGRLDRFEALAVTSYAAQSVQASKLHLDVDGSSQGVKERSALHAIDQLEKCARIHSSVLRDLERSLRLLLAAIAAEEAPGARAS